MAVTSEADILGYGGAAGGGKTDLLLGLAMYYHRKSIIYRREAAELDDIVERSKQMAAGHGKYNANLHTWRGLPGDRSVKFDGVQDGRALSKKKGRPRDFIGFDEATEFPEHFVRFLMTWLRTVIPGQRRRVVLTFNPPTSAEGRWVLKFFGPWLDPKHPNPALPGEIRWYAQVDGEEVERPDGQAFEHNGKTIRPLSRTFIPARLADNPYLDSPEYRAMLDNLPEPLKSQMLEGDFSAGIEDDAWQVIPTEWVTLAQERWEAGGRPVSDDGVALPLTATGVDVAHGGKDQTVLQKRYGNWFAWPEAYPGTQTPRSQDTAGLVAEALTEGGYANIDVIGVGAGVYDVCLDLELNAVPINFSEGILAWDRSGTQKFVNLRAYAYWSFREALDPVKGDNLALPPDPELLADLTGLTWRSRMNGIQIEDKQEAKKRTGLGFHKGDACVLAGLPDFSARVS